MDQLKKGLEISIHGDAADRAVREFRAQAAQWQVALPDVPPLVLDFGLGDFARTGLIEYWIANENAAGYCGKYLFVFDGQSCPRHHHKTKHETFFVVKGALAVECGGRQLELREGGRLPIPAGVPHSFRGAGPALLLELSMPCVIDDNFFEDPRIPIGGNYRKTP
ncbi:MAG: D-lyxose/D-mannose family sugar isomerase [Alphaproteobacteria bacterium]|nr:D-lyxose/D-mannose family sugar isomerase [Alphaproteobacteria bacterium]